MNHLLSLRISVKRYLKVKLVKCNCTYEAISFHCVCPKERLLRRMFVFMNLLQGTLIKMLLAMTSYRMMRKTHPTGSVCHCEERLHGKGAIELSKLNYLQLTSDEAISSHLLKDKISEGRLLRRFIRA